MRVRSLEISPSRSTAVRDVLGELCELAAAATDARAAGAWLLDEDGERDGAWWGVDGIEVPVFESPCGRVLETERPVVISDFEAEGWGPAHTASGETLSSYIGVPIPDTDGEPVGAVCVLDPKARTFTSTQVKALELIAKQVPVHLQRERALRAETMPGGVLQAVLDGLRDAVVIQSDDSEGMITNDAFWDLVGLPREEVTDADVPTLLKAFERSFEDFDEVLRSGAATAAAGAGRRDEQVKLADGRVLTRDYVPIEVDGVRRHHLWHLRDVTRQHHVEAELESTRGRFHAIASAAPLGLIVTDASGLPVFHSSGTVTLLSLDSEEDLTPESWARHILAEDLPLVEEQWSRALQGEFVEWYYRVRRSEGGLRHVRGTASAVRSRDGELQGVVSMLIDVSGQAEAREALERSLRVLERQNEDLVTLARARDDLVATVSHELRTPLTSISSFLQLLADEPGQNDFQREAYAAMERNTERLQMVVGDLLLLKDGGHDLKLTRESLDLGALAAASVEGFRGRAEEAGVRLEHHGAAHVAVLGDPARVAQALDNLVDNALKFTPRGGSITLTAHRREHLGVLEVANTGRGISPEDLPLVFDRFYQAKSSSGRGSGLGLAIVKMLLEQQGGEVSVASEPGEGATFALALEAEQR